LAAVSVLDFSTL